MRPNSTQIKSRRGSGVGRPYELFVCVAASGNPKYTMNTDIERSNRPPFDEIERESRRLRSGLRISNADDHLPQQRVTRRRTGDVDSASLHPISGSASPACTGSSSCSTLSQIPSHGVTYRYCLYYPEFLRVPHKNSSVSLLNWFV